MLTGVECGAMGAYARRLVAHPDEVDDLITSTVSSPPPRRARAARPIPTFPLNKQFLETPVDRLAAAVEVLDVDDRLRAIKTSSGTISGG
jgi:hypothetical protein